MDRHIAHGQNANPIPNLRSREPTKPSRAIDAVQLRATEVAWLHPGCPSEATNRSAKLQQVVDILCRFPARRVSKDRWRQ